MPKVILITPMAEISEIDYSDSDYSSANEKYFNQEWFESWGFEKNFSVMVGELPKGMYNCIASTLLSNKRGTFMPIMGNAIFTRANEDGDTIDLSIKEFKKICKENGIKRTWYTVL